MADQIEQIGGVLAIVNGEGAIESDALGVFAQKTRADGVEGSRPGDGVASSTLARSRMTFAR